MPYRRLPNTDQARIRAMKALLQKAAICDVYDLPVTLKTLTAVTNFLPKFVAAQLYYMECYSRQSKAALKHQSNVKTARLYVSHFIQVLDLAVVRSEIRASLKSLYGLEPTSNAVPDLATEKALLEWGRKIIDGEKLRTSQGGIPIYNPTIARVKVCYDIFVESYEKQKDLQGSTTRSLATLAAMREDADALILDAWNQIEAKFSEVTPAEKRLDICRDYGLIYYYRTGEKVNHDA